MKIIIETIKHNAQRYPTCGDWSWNGDTLTIKVSQIAGGDWRKESLVAVHEAVEALLCRHARIDEAAVTAFDKEFERNRPQDSTAEPGDDDNAPYRRQHCISTGIERLLAAEMDVPWAEYEEELNLL